MPKTYGESYAAGHAKAMESHGLHDGYNAAGQEHDDAKRERLSVSARDTRSATIRRVDEALAYSRACRQGRAAPRSIATMSVKPIDRSKVAALMLAAQKALSKSQHQLDAVRIGSPNLRRAQERVDLARMLVRELRSALGGAA